MITQPKLSGKPGQAPAMSSQCRFPPTSPRGLSSVIATPRSDTRNNRQSAYEAKETERCTTPERSSRDHDSAAVAMVCVPSPLDAWPRR